MRTILSSAVATILLTSTSAAAQVPADDAAVRAAVTAGYAGRDWPPPRVLAAARDAGRKYITVASEVLGEAAA